MFAAAPFRLSLLFPFSLSLSRCPSISHSPLGCTIVEYLLSMFYDFSGKIASRG